LPALLEQMLTRAGAGVADLGAIVVGLGPGSFTGLRIGLATAKGISYAASIPLAGASSLAAMALAAAADLPDGTLLVPALDARKGEVYCGFFRSRDGRVEQEGPEEALSPEKLIERLADKPGARVFGIGRQAYPPLHALPAAGTGVSTPDAFALVRLVRELPAFSKDATFGLEPHYVRPSDSEWSIKQKKAK
jgi:tRNA threonylcarbamoyladenosine biosynthesis protein TsaB